MRKYLIVTYLLVNISIVSIGQTTLRSERIATFCKAWGVLKYFHPSIAQGKFDWDSVFVNNIQKVIDTKTNIEFNELLTIILNTVGNISEIKQTKAPDSLFTSNKTNINWITKSPIFNNQVKNRLKLIYENKSQADNKYIKIIYNTADFSGENKYDSIGFPGTQYRLLFLARFWNIINYFAPYKYLTGNWDDVLKIFIPRFINSTDTLSYYKTLLQLCKSLSDGHSQLTLPGQRSVTDLIYGKYTVPFYCEIVNGKVAIRKVANDSTAKASNLRQGDVILKINNEDVNEVINNRKKYVSASNQAVENHQLSRFLLDGQKPFARLTIKRGNNIFNTTVKRLSTSERNWGEFINYTYNDAGYKKLPDSILLIYAMQIWNGNLDTLKYMIKQSRAVIFDVRNYPQNDAFFYIVDPFLPEPKLINYSTIAIADFPGLFKWRPSPKIGRINDSVYKGKVVILADERTQSQGEYSCMVLQTIPGCITIGSQTAGADGIKTEIPMGGGLSVSYSGYGIFYPDKRQTQRIGIKINIPVKKTIQSLVHEKDEILVRALQYISNSKISN